MSAHVMIDIETLGTRPGSSILSIGACRFDPAGKGVDSTFYVNIDRATSAEIGCTYDDSTVKWWSRQSQEAVAKLKEDQQHVIKAFEAFSVWFSNVGGKYPWSHGATFDLVLMEAVYEKLRKRAPWRFYNARDTRTIYHLAGVSPDRAVGTHHYALDDAIAQAEAVQQAWQLLKGTA